MSFNSSQNIEIRVVLFVNDVKLTIFYDCLLICHFMDLRIKKKDLFLTFCIVYSCVGVPVCFFCYSSIHVGFEKGIEEIFGFILGWI